MRSQQVTLEEVTVSGSGLNSKVATVELAGFYDPADGGLIGTARGPDALDDARSRLLPAAAEVTVSTSLPNLAFVVAVKGLALGTWRADYIEVRYSVDGEMKSQRIEYGLGVCVVKKLGDACDAGLPEWWGK